MSSRGGGAGASSDAVLRAQKDQLVAARRYGIPTRHAWSCKKVTCPRLPSTNRYTNEELWLFVSKYDFPLWAQGFGDLAHNDDKSTRSYTAIALFLSSFFSPLIGYNPNGIVRSGTTTFPGVMGEIQPKVVMQITWLLKKIHLTEDGIMNEDRSYQMTPGNIQGMLIRISALDGNYEFWRAIRICLVRNAMTVLAHERNITDASLNRQYNELLKVEKELRPGVCLDNFSTILINGGRDYTKDQVEQTPWSNLDDPLTPYGALPSLSAALVPRASINHSLLATRLFVSKQPQIAEMQIGQLPGVQPCPHESDYRKVYTWAAYYSLIGILFANPADFESKEKISQYDTYTTCFERWDPKNPKNVFSLETAIDRMRAFMEKNNAKIADDFLNPAKYYADFDTALIAQPYNAISTYEIDITTSVMTRDVFASLCTMRFPHFTMLFEKSLEQCQRTIHAHEMTVMRGLIARNIDPFLRILSKSDDWLRINHFTREYIDAAMRGYVLGQNDNRRNDDGDDDTDDDMNDIRKSFRSLVLNHTHNLSLADRAHDDECHARAREFCDAYAPPLGRALTARIDSTGTSKIQSNYSMLANHFNKQYMECLRVRQFDMNSYGRLLRALRHDAAAEFFYVFTSGHYNNGRVMNAMARHVATMSQRSVYDGIAQVDHRLTAFGNRVAADLLQMHGSLGIVTGHHYFHLFMNTIRTVAVHGGLSKFHVLCLGPAAAGKSHMLFLAMACSVPSSLQMEQSKSNQAGNDETAEDDIIYLSDEASPLVSCDPEKLSDQQREMYNRERVTRSEGEQSGRRSVVGAYTAEYRVSNKVTFVSNTNKLEAPQEDSMLSRHAVIPMSIETSNKKAELAIRQFLSEDPERKQANVIVAERLISEQALAAIVGKMQSCFALAPTCTIIAHILAPLVMYGIRDFMPGSRERIRPNTRMMNILRVNPIYRATNALFTTTTAPMTKTFDLSMFYAYEPWLCASLEDFHWALGYMLHEYVDIGSFLAIYSLVIARGFFDPTKLRPLFKPRKRDERRTSICIEELDAQTPLGVATDNNNNKLLQWSVLGWLPEHYGRDCDDDMPAYWKHEATIHTEMVRTFITDRLRNPAYKRCILPSAGGGGGGDPMKNRSDDSNAIVVYDPNYIEIHGKLHDIVSIACTLLERYAGASVNSVSFFVRRWMHSTQTLEMPVLRTLNNPADELQWATYFDTTLKRSRIMHSKCPVIEYNSETNVLYISTYWVAACSTRSIWTTAYTCTEDQFTLNDTIHVMPRALPGSPYLTDMIRLRPNPGIRLSMGNPLSMTKPRDHAGRGTVVSSASTFLAPNDIVRILYEFNPDLTTAEADCIASLVRTMRANKSPEARLRERVPFEPQADVANVLFDSAKDEQLVFEESVEVICYKYFVCEEALTLVRMNNALPIKQWPSYPGNLELTLRKLNVNVNKNLPQATLLEPKSLMISEQNNNQAPKRKGNYRYPETFMSSAAFRLLGTSKIQFNDDIIDNCHVRLEVGATNSDIGGIKYRTIQDDSGGADDSSSDQRLYNNVTDGSLDISLAGLLADAQERQRAEIAKTKISAFGGGGGGDDDDDAEEVAGIDTRISMTVANAARERLAIQTRRVLGLDDQPKIALPLPKQPYLLPSFGGGDATTTIKGISYGASVVRKTQPPPPPTPPSPPLKRTNTSLLLPPPPLRVRSMNQSLDSAAAMDVDEGSESMSFAMPTASRRRSNIRLPDA